MSSDIPPSDIRPTGKVRSFLKILGESLSGRHHDYTSGPLGRAIALLAIPMVLEMVMESVFAVVDIYFVARLGADAMATVGLAESMLTLVYAIAVGLSVATTAMVARRVGEKKPEQAAAAGAQSIYLGIVISAVIGLPCWLLAPRLLELMGAGSGVIEIGSDYTAILLGTNVVIMLLFVNNAVFRGAGDATVAMRTLWLANGINIALDPCLIFGLGPFPELGVTGAALATVIGRGTGVLYQFAAYRRGHGRLHMRGSAWRPRLRVLLRLLRLSVGGMGQHLVATGSWVAMIRIVSDYGSAALAGYTIAVRIIVFALLPSWGLANAAATLVGQNLGAGKPERAERAVWLCGFWNMVFLGLVTVVFVSTAPWLVSFFTDKPDVLPVGVSSLRIMSYGYVAYAWGMILTQAFNGAGDTLTPTWINIACFWALEIPLALVLAYKLGMGPSGVFWSVAISEAVLAGVAASVFRRGDWKRRVL